MKLKHRTALITGAGRGIGRAIALAFAREGADLVLTARTGEELDSARAECRALGVNVTRVAADLARASVINEIFAAIKGGRIDILVNNAGVGTSPPRPTVMFDDAFWDETLRINLTVPYLLIKRVLPEMTKAGYGRIINIASLASKVGCLHGAAYAASKHGLLGLTRTVALEVVKEGVTVNAICPGAVATRTNDSRMAYDAARLGKSAEEVAASTTPLGRRLRTDEISPLATFLASDDAVAISGQAYNVDAGAIMY